MAPPLWASVSLSVKMGEITTKSAGLVHDFFNCHLELYSPQPRFHTHCVQGTLCGLHCAPPLETLSVFPAAWLECAVAVLQMRTLRFRETCCSLLHSIKLESQA